MKIIFVAFIMEGQQYVCLRIAAFVMLAEAVPHPPRQQRNPDLPIKIIAKKIWKSFVFSLLSEMEKEKETRF